MVRESCGGVMHRRSAPVKSLVRIESVIEQAFQVHPVGVSGDDVQLPRRRLGCRMRFDAPECKSEKADDGGDGVIFYDGVSFWRGISRGDNGYPRPCIYRKLAGRSGRVSGTPIRRKLPIQSMRRGDR